MTVFFRAAPRDPHPARGSYIIKWRRDKRRAQPLRGPAAFSGSIMLTDCNSVRMNLAEWLNWANNFGMTPQGLKVPRLSFCYPGYQIHILVTPVPWPSSIFHFGAGAGSKRPTTLGAIVLFLHVCHPTRPHRPLQLFPQVLS